MFAKNPILIQKAPRNSTKSPPLFLIHDASGTVLSYYRLGGLDRDVYGIHDPHFTSGDAWRGGIPEMATKYIEMIKAVVSYGHVILGGWSFGGLVSVQMAHMLQGSSLEVDGIVLIDSIFSKSRRANENLDIQGPALSASLAPEMKERVLSSLVRSMCMAGDWHPPRWLEMDSQPGQALHVVLIKATSRVDRDIAGDGFLLDSTRDDESLGWKNYQEGFITSSLYVSGTHYTVFDAAHIDDMTRVLREALHSILNKRHGKV